MKLTYRGISYALPTLTNMPEVAVVTAGTYRGTALIIQHYNIPSSLRNLVNLKYRGAYYHPVAQKPDELASALA